MWLSIGFTTGAVLELGVCTLKAWQEKRNSSQHHEVILALGIGRRRVTKSLGIKRISEFKSECCVFRKKEAAAHAEANRKRRQRIIRHALGCLSHTYTKQSVEVIAQDQKTKKTKLSVNSIVEHVTHVRRFE